MTFSIATEICLEGISASARKTLDERIQKIGRPLSDATDLYAMPASELDLVSDAGTKWEILRLCEPDQPNLGPVPCYIYLDLNAPNAVTGQDEEHGVSVSAAGVVALEKVRTWLAQSGLSRDDVDQLEASDVSLRGATITYLIGCGTKEDVDEVMRTIWVTACALYPNQRRLRNSSEGVITIPGHGFTVVFTPEAVVADGTTDSAVVDRVSYRVRIEVRLRGNFLSRMRLSRLNDWRDGDGTGLYKEVFGLTVGRVLRLDDKLRRRAPPGKVYKCLSETEAALLRWVVKDGRDPAEFKGIVESRHPSAVKLDLRRRILAVAQVDIEIPWRLHAKLHCAELAEWLVYPGDHHPSAERVSQCFCRENWPRLLEQLRNRYEAALRA